MKKPRCRGELITLPWLMTTWVFWLQLYGALGELGNTSGGLAMQAPPATAVSYCWCTPPPPPPQEQVWRPECLTCRVFWELAIGSWTGQVQWEQAQAGILRKARPVFQFAAGPESSPFLSLQCPSVELEEWPLFVTVTKEMGKTLFLRFSKLFQGRHRTDPQVALVQERTLYMQ
jgi:hypothetical protein